MNKERFHNQLALRLGYDTIVNNKQIAIRVDYKKHDVPWIFLELPNGISEGFLASDVPTMIYDKFSYLKLLDSEDSGLLIKDIIFIIDATYQAYLNSVNMHRSDIKI